MTRRWTAFSRRTVLHSAAVALALAVAGCADSKAPFKPEPIAFDGAPVWRAPADRIEIEQTPNVAAPGPAVAARLATLPVDVMRAWPKQRLRADPGARGVLVYTIERAEASERYLEPKKGVTSWFISGPEAEFTVALAAHVNLFDATGGRRGSARAEATSVGELKENADETERRRLWDRLMREAAGRLDRELQKHLPTGLPGLEETR